jgi:hypothetical protein
MVKFGNGTTSDSILSTTLSLKQGSYLQKIEFFIADIHITVILGIPSVSAVHITKIDWCSRLVQFFDGEQLHSLTGEDSEFIGKHPLLLSSLDFEDGCKSSAFESWGICSIAELEAGGEVSQDTKSEEDPELTELLLSFEDIFDKPAMPPPSREEDHEIHLLQGSKPPPIRGIGRLSEDQLALLKSTITELLDKGFIRPSTSPFGAMVLFARKELNHSSLLRMFLHSFKKDPATLNTAKVPLKRSGNVKEIKLHFITDRQGPV